MLAVFQKLARKWFLFRIERLLCRTRDESEFSLRSVTLDRKFSRLSATFVRICGAEAIPSIRTIMSTAALPKSIRKEAAECLIAAGGDLDPSELVAMVRCSGGFVYFELVKYMAKQKPTDLASCLDVRDIMCIAKSAFAQVELSSEFESHRECSPQQFNIVATVLPHYSDEQLKTHKDHLLEVHDRSFDQSVSYHIDFLKALYTAILRVLDPEFLKRLLRKHRLFSRNRLDVLHEGEFLVTAVLLCGDVDSARDLLRSLWIGLENAESHDPPLAKIYEDALIRLLSGLGSTKQKGLVVAEMKGDRYRDFLMRWIEAAGKDAEDLLLSIAETDEHFVGLFERKPETLTRLARSEHERVRDKAINHLAATAREQDMDILKNVLVNPFDFTAKKSAEALKKMGWTPATHEEAVYYSLAGGGGPPMELSESDAPFLLRLFARYGWRQELVYLMFSSRSSMCVTLLLKDAIRTPDYSHSHMLCAGLKQLVASGYTLTTEEALAVLDLPDIVLETHFESSRTDGNHWSTTSTFKPESLRTSARETLAKAGIMVPQTVPRTVKQMGYA